MADFYAPSSRALQDEQGTRKLADRIELRLVRDFLDDDDQTFIARLDMFFLATVDDRGRPTCSYKGGERGFVRAIDAKTLVFPSYDGNGMYLSMGNVMANGEVGLLFICFEERRRLRVGGHATIDRADPLLADYPEAEHIVRIAVREVFPNCPRYIHKNARQESSRFVPRAGCTTPVPAWKQSEWAKDALPEGDPALDPSREVLKK